METTGSGGQVVGFTDLKDTCFLYGKGGTGCGVLRGVWRGMRPFQEEKNDDDTPTVSDARNLGRSGCGVWLARMFAAERNSSSARSTSSAVQSSSARIKSVIRRDETILRLGGNGDNWHMTWAADDRQYVSMCDGYGWPGMPGYDMVGQEYNSRIYAIKGAPPDVEFEFLPGYPEIVSPHPRPKDMRPYYYGLGTFALDGRIYQFLSTTDVVQPGKEASQWFVGTKLIYSSDQGRTWCNQDGSTPVVLETWGHRSRDNMVFFQESQDAFSVLSVLQMGRNYEFNRDGYVYVYSPNGATDGTANELVMFRTPKTQLLNRRAYEFFAGLRPNGRAEWTRDIDARVAVHTFPRGWVGLHPHSWVPSVVYNAPLGLYMMASWGMGIGSSGEIRAKPSYLGFWVAPTPWGPWGQIHEELAWMPGNDRRACAYEPQIAPKWIAKDGKSFWLVWGDLQAGDSEQNTLSESEQRDPTGGLITDDRLSVEAKRLALPYYAFNAQRVDLIV